MADLVAHTCHSSYVGSTNRKIVVQAHMGIKQDPISKTTNAKRAGRVARVIEQVVGPEFKPPSTAKNKQKELHLSNDFPGVIF
jgi:tagatose-1,6-bisphosphate aldolase non-catalytic subunit AgaZ/GatZ